MNKLFYFVFGITDASQKQAFKLCFKRNLLSTKFNMPTCQKCGKSLGADNQFCQSCGAQININTDAVTYPQGIANKTSQSKKWIKYFIIVAVLVVVGFFLNNYLRPKKSPQPPNKDAGSSVLASIFPSFDQLISIGSNSDVTVQETVNVNFHDRRHGIYRNIPVKYTTSSGNTFDLRMNVVSITDGSGNNLQYSVSYTGDTDEVKIGDPNIFVTGSQTYIITYSISNVLLSFNDQDQLYWNVISDPWGDLGMPDTINTSVLLPGQVKAADIKIKCFTALGSNAAGDCKQGTKDGAAKFSVSGGKPLTIVVGWPKNAVAK
jgi:Predicted membrane protein (DUF2207)